MPAEATMLRAYFDGGIAYNHARKPNQGTTMALTFKAGLSPAFALALAAGTPVAAEQEHGHEAARPAARPAAHQGEPHPGPDSGQILQVEYGVFA